MSKMSMDARAEPCERGIMPRRGNSLRGTLGHAIKAVFTWVYVFVHSTGYFILAFGAGITLLVVLAPWIKSAGIALGSVTWLSVAAYCLLISAFCLFWISVQGMRLFLAAPEAQGVPIQTILCNRLLRSRLACSILPILTVVLAQYYDVAHVTLSVVICICSPVGLVCALDSLLIVQRLLQGVYGDTALEVAEVAIYLRNSDQPPGSTGGKRKTAEPEVDKSAVLTRPGWISGGGGTNS